MKNIIEHPAPRSREHRAAPAGAAVDIQTSYTMGGNYKIASRNPHISWFFSADH